MRESNSGGYTRKLRSDGILVLGLTALIHPIEVSPRCLQIDMPVMLLDTVTVLPMMWTGRKLVRFEGGLLVTAIVIYTVVRIAISGSG